MVFRRSGSFQVHYRSNLFPVCFKFHTHDCYLFIHLAKKILLETRGEVLKTFEMFKHDADRIIINSKFLVSSDSSNGRSVISIISLYRIDFFKCRQCEIG